MTHIPNPQINAFLKVGFWVFVAGYRPQQTPKIHIFDMLAAGFSDLKKSLPWRKYLLTKV